MSLMPEYREQLMTAAAGRGRRSPLSRGMSAVPALVVVLVALAIAAGAMLALRHDSSGGGSTGSTSPPANGPSPTVVAARAQLKAELGVLRRGRPQTSPTIIPLIFRPVAPMPKGSYVANHTRLDRALARAVRVGDYEVGVLPASWRPPGGTHRSEGLIASFFGPGVDQERARAQRRDPVPQISSLTRPASPSVIAHHGLIVTSEIASGVDRGGIVVPDGVAAVRLSSLRITRTRTTAPAAVPIVPATTAVHDNVAPLALTGLTVAHLGLSRTAVVGRQYMARPAVSRSCHFAFAIYALPASARIIWLSASGGPIARLATKLTLYVTSDHPVASRRDIRACEAMKRARR